LELALKLQCSCDLVVVEAGTLVVVAVNLLLLAVLRALAGGVVVTGSRGVVRVANHNNE